MSPATHNFIKNKNSKKKDSIEDRGNVSQRGKLPNINDTVLSRSPRGVNDSSPKNNHNNE